MTNTDTRTRMAFDAPEWRDFALCRVTDPEAFFPETGENGRPAKRVCSRCEVRDACLAEALAQDERFGIWGGLTAAERRKHYPKRRLGRVNRKDAAGHSEQAQKPRRGFSKACEQ